MTATATRAVRRIPPSPFLFQTFSSSFFRRTSKKIVALFAFSNLFLVLLHFLRPQLEGVRGEGVDEANLEPVEEVPVQARLVRLTVVRARDQL